MTRVSVADVATPAGETRKPKPQGISRLGHIVKRSYQIKPKIPRDPAQIPPDLADRLCELLAGTGPRVWPLYLHGDEGTGKTCAALCVFDCVAHAAYVTLDGLVVDILRRNDHAWRYLADASLLIVDEIGIRSTDSDLEYVAMKKIADIREHEPAIWISNHAPEEIEKLYDERVYGRICTGTIHELMGKSRRAGFQRRVS